MKVIFLDINGVIEPFFSTMPKNKIPNLAEYLTEKFSDERYLSIDKHVLELVYYTFQKEAIISLLNLVKVTNATIVISSSWRVHFTLDEIILLFNIHGLGEYIIGVTPVLRRPREYEILEYLSTHKVSNYVVFDDAYLSTDLLPNFILVTDYLKAADCTRAAKLLK